MNEDYIKQLLEDVDVYTSYPRPRGKGSRQNIHRIHYELLDCFEKLSEMGRLDIVPTILIKLINTQDLKSNVPMDTWIWRMTDLSPKDCLSLFHMDKEVFKQWLTKTKRDSDIIKFAEKIGKVCSKDEFLEFVNFVKEYHGKVPGIFYCFPSNSENSPDQILFHGKACIVTFDCIDTMNNSDSIATADVYLKILPIDDEVDSLKISDCMVNGISLGDEDYGFYADEKITNISVSNKDWPFEAYKTGYIKMPKTNFADGGLKFPDIDNISIEVLDEVPQNTNDIYAQLTLGLINGKWIPITNSDSDLNFANFTIYTDFFEENRIKEIEKLEIKFVFLDDDENTIEKSPNILLELDYTTGNYIVKNS